MHSLVASRWQLLRNSATSQPASHRAEAKIATSSRHQRHHKTDKLACQQSSSGCCIIIMIRANGRPVPVVNEKNWIVHFCTQSSFRRRLLELDDDVIGNQRVRRIRIVLESRERPDEYTKQPSPATAIILSCKTRPSSDASARPWLPLFAKSQ